MIILKKLIVIALILCVPVLSVCGTGAAYADDGRVRVVATIFAPYDFTREIAGDSANIAMLLQPGADVHSFEPTPQDIIRIQNSDVFIHVGGESWVQDILASIDTSEMIIIRMMDDVRLLYEEIIQGMDYTPADSALNYNPGWCEVCASEAGSHKPVFDKHVWTSPQNAILIVESIARALALSDPDNAYLYARNAADYIARLKALDTAFSDVADSAARNTIIFGDRFAFRYFAYAYNLDYFAAFPGCRGNTEPSAATVAFLIDIVNSENIPVVFHAEMSDKRLANTIAQATGAGVRLLHASHNVTRDEFAEGITYLDLMTQNIEALRAALQ